MANNERDNPDGPAAEKTPADRGDLPETVDVSRPGLESTRSTGPRGPASSTDRPEKIGQYELLDVLGRGGMGVVYRARQAALDRVVALKTIRSGTDAEPEEIERFRAEAEAAAQLDHPHIVPIYEVGESGGRHYLAMGYVAGSTLAAAVREDPLPPREAAALCVKVAAAVEYAHRQGVIHRDLKPGNILLDAAGEPRVVDFGLAKRLDTASELTTTGQILGTPSYMPPEQASGAAKAGPQVDVYALGAILYCLLTGRPPFQGANPVETLRLVMENEPVGLRQINSRIPVDLDTIAFKALQKDPKRRYASAAEFAADLERFLEGKPILARPISSAGRLYRWSRRNPVIASLACLFATSLLVGIVVSTYFRFQAEARATDAELAGLRASAGERSAIVSLGKEREATSKLTGALTKLAEEERAARQSDYISSIGDIRRRLDAADLERARSGLLRLRPPNDKPDLRGFEYFAFQAAAFPPLRRLTGHHGPLAAAAVSRDSRLLATAGRDHTVRLWQLADGRLVHTLRGMNVPVISVAFTRDGKRLVAGGQQGKLFIWDVKEGKRVKELAEHQRNVEAVAISLDGKWLATGTAGTSDLGRVRIFTTSDWKLVTEFEPHRQGVAGHPWGISSLDFSSDGQLLATGGYDGRVKTWKTADWSLAHEFKGHTGWVRTVAFNDVGSRLASGSDDETIRLWNVADGKLDRVLQGTGQGVVLDLAYLPRRQLLCAATLTGGIVWDLQNDLPSGVPGGNTAVVASPDGRWLALDGKPAAVQLISTADLGNPIAVPHSGWVRAIAFSSDGKRLAVGGGRGTITIYRVPGYQVVAQLEHALPVLELEFSANAKFLHSTHQAPRGRIDAVLWDLSTNALWQPLADAPLPIHKVRFSRDGKRAAVVRHQLLEGGKQAGGRPLPGGFDVAVWNLTDGKRERVIAAGELTRLEPGKFRSSSYKRLPLSDVFFSHDGTRLVTVFPTLQIWNLADGKPLNELSTRRTSYALELAGGKLVSFDAVLDDSTRVEVATWDLASGQRQAGAYRMRRRSVLGHSSDGMLWALRSQFRDVYPQLSIVVWDHRRGRAAHVLQGHSQLVSAARFSPDDRTLVTASQDRSVIFWDVETGRELTTTAYHRQSVLGLRFSPDGSLLASGGGSRLLGDKSGKPGELRLWRAPRGEITEPVAAAPALGAASGSDSEPELAWEMAIPVPQRQIHAILPNGRGLLVGGSIDTMRLVDPRDGKHLTFELPDAPALRFSRTAGIGRASFSPSGKWLATVSRSSHASVLVWDMTQYRLAAKLGSFSGIDDKGVAIADDRMVASVDDDGKVTIYAAGDGQPTAGFPTGMQCTAIALNPAADRLAVLGRTVEDEKNGVAVFELPGGNQVRFLETGDTAPERLVLDADFLLAAGGRAAPRLFVWRTDNWKSVFTTSSRMYDPMIWRDPKTQRFLSFDDRRHLLVIDPTANWIESWSVPRMMDLQAALPDDDQRLIWIELSGAGLRAKRYRKLRP